MSRPMLSTVDNPFSPFTQWEDWRRFDRDKGYYTMEYLARIANTGDTIGDTDYDDELDRAIDEIVKMNINGMYRKVFEKDFDVHRGEGEK